MSDVRRICLLIDTSTSWGTRLIKGVSRHAREVGDWLIHVEPWGRYERFRVPQGWEGHGIIARVNHKALVEDIKSLGLPTVNLSWYPFSNEHVARCTVDPVVSGQMAADYFLSAGHKQFAFCGPFRQLDYPDIFGESYCKALQKKGYDCDVYPAPKGDQRTIAWSAHLASLLKWLKQLPPPTAMLCWSAARGRQVTEACHYAGIRVPDEVAVLGGDHDDLMADISSPPLSTLDQPAEHIGYEAAQLLDGMMRGKKARQRPLYFPPTGIIARHSTDALAIQDELVRSALLLIRERAVQGIRVSDVVRELAVARRALEQRFVRLVGRSPAAEIRRVRIEAAKRLLVDTDRTIAQISRESGFGHQDLFARVFRRSVGLTPSQFRNQHQHS